MSKYTIVVLFLICFLTVNVNGQTNNTSLKDSLSKKIPYVKGQEYVLGGITVTGLKKFSEETVKIFTGLRNGQMIKLPGDKLTSAIKKLYESKQFSNVDVYLAKLDGNVAYLQFDVQELPQLNEVVFSGVKKSKRKELEKDTDLKTGAMVTENLIVTSTNFLSP